MPTPGFQTRKLADKTLTSPNCVGKQIAVSAAQVDSNPIVYEITAIIEEHVEIQRHTVGAMGVGPVLTVPELQAFLDECRQKVADAVAWQAAAAEIGPQVS